jgi:hypothetical protein
LSTTLERLRENEEQRPRPPLDILAAYRDRLQALREGEGLVSVKQDFSVVITDFDKHTGEVKEVKAFQKVCAATDLDSDTIRAFCSTLETTLRPKLPR